jgi:hypothetical protein
MDQGARRFCSEANSTVVLAYSVLVTTSISRIDTCKRVRISSWLQPTERNCQIHIRYYLRSETLVALKLKLGFAFCVFSVIPL